MIQFEESKCCPVDDDGTVHWDYECESISGIIDPDFVSYVETQNVCNECMIIPVCKM